MDVPPSGLPQSSAPTERFDAAFAALTQALGDALATTGQHERVNAAYLEYMQLLQAALAGQDVQPQGAQAYARYIEMLQGALSALPQQEKALEAFRQYMRVVRDAWAGVDSDTLDPAAVAAIAQTMLVASSTLAGVGRPPRAP